MAEPELKKLISAAYPFGQRSFFPYKAWLAEIKHQLQGAAIRTAKECPQIGLFLPTIDKEEAS